MSNHAVLKVRGMHRSRCSFELTQFFSLFFFFSIFILRPVRYDLFRLFDFRFSFFPRFLNTATKRRRRSSFARYFRSNSVPRPECFLLDAPLPGTPLLSSASWSCFSQLDAPCESRARGIFERRHRRHFYFEFFLSNRS